MVSTLFLWLVFVTFTSQTEASHFRGGIITWKPDKNIANKVIHANKKSRFVRNVLALSYFESKDST